MSQQQTFNEAVEQVAGRDINNYQVRSEWQRYSYEELIKMYNQAGSDMKQSANRQQFNRPKLMSMAYGVVMLLIGGYVILNLDAFNTISTPLFIMVPSVPMIFLGKASADIHLAEKAKIEQLDQFRKRLHQEITIREAHFKLQMTNQQARE